MGVTDPGTAGATGLSDLENRWEFGGEKLSSLLFFCVPIIRLMVQVGSTEMIPTGLM